MFLILLIILCINALNVHVCVVYATLCSVKPEIFDIVGTSLQSPRGIFFIKNSKWCLSESVTMQTGFL